MTRLFLLVLLSVLAMVWGAAKPMEPLSSYNVILVHGAANSLSGFPCGTDSTYPEAFNVLQEYEKSKQSETGEDSTDKKASWQLGGAVGMIGSYTQREKLTAWLDSAVFEDYIYRKVDNIRWIP